MDEYTKNCDSEETIPIFKDMSLRLYRDTRPHNNHIADLQKGLIIVNKDVELVGEGTGFGVPIVHYNDRTYFSSTATVQTCHRRNCTLATKQFALDMISQKQLGRIQLENKPMHKLTSYVDELYRRHRHWRVLTWANVSKSLGLRTTFVKDRPIGTVSVTYHIKPPLINIEASFSSVNKDKLETVFILNEQSSRLFRKYQDSSGTVLWDEQIGAWEKLETEWATMTSKTGDIGFRLWKVKNALLYRGREYLHGTYDWTGLDYELRPETTRFEYDIEMVGSTHQK